MLMLILNSNKIHLKFLIHYHGWVRVKVQFTLQARDQYVSLSLKQSEMFMQIAIFFTQLRYMYYSFLMQSCFKAINDLSAMSNPIQSDKLSKGVCEVSGSSSQVNSVTSWANSEILQFRRTYTVSRLAYN